jgi:hypothetical protein
VMDAQALERIDGWRREFAALEIHIGSEGRVQISLSASRRRSRSSASACRQSPLSGQKSRT